MNNQRQLEESARIVRTIRHALGWTRKKFAAYIHHQKGAVRRWERGETCPSPKARALIKNLMEKQGLSVKGVDDWINIEPNRANRIRKVRARKKRRAAAAGAQLAPSSPGHAKGQGPVRPVPCGTPPEPKGGKHEDHHENAHPRTATSSDRETG